MMQTTELRAVTIANKLNTVAENAEERNFKM